jgi:uncharacterized protein (TIGR03435 family)
MIPVFLSAKWLAMAPALGNHLWQSTLFAIVAGLLTLLLRKNGARTRYWLWLAASLKFLVPFSLLVMLGGSLAPTHTPAGTPSELYVMIEQVGRPFAPATPPVITHAVAPQNTAPSPTHLLSLLLPAAWMCGLVATLLAWCVRWRRVAAVLRDAEPSHEGREFEALRRLEKMARARRLLPIMLSKASLEPGIFGIFRPILIWPVGISARLENAHLEAILAHELRHVSRRDNLAAAVHMVVEALFWFHPLVWWLGARLVEERERACDEEVLALGSHRHVYAESILKTCEFCVEAPLACMSGVTGSDLKKRMVRIMTANAARKLDFSQKLLLSAAGLFAITLPIMFGLLNVSRSHAQSAGQSNPATTFGYEVASIKPSKPDSGGIVRFLFYPDGLTATNISLRMLIRDAYGIEDHQLAGAPGWLDSDRYDIEAKMEPSVVDQLRKLGPDAARAARQSMLQALLEDRLKLKAHRETKELPVYTLVVAKNGPKLQEAKPGDTYPNGLKGPNGVGKAGMMRMGRGDLTAQGLSMASVVRLLSQQLGRSVLDKTGLTSTYDFTLHWTPDDSQVAFKDFPGGAQSDGSGPSDTSRPSLFTAIQEQLGLKLESQKGPVEIIVIDHVEKPSAN